MPGHLCSTERDGSTGLHQRDSSKALPFGSETQIMGILLIMLLLFQSTLQPPWHTSEGFEFRAGEAPWMKWWETKMKLRMSQHFTCCYFQLVSIVDNYQVYSFHSYFFIQIHKWIDPMLFYVSGTTWNNRYNVLKLMVFRINPTFCWWYSIWSAPGFIWTGPE